MNFDTLGEIFDIQIESSSLEINIEMIRKSITKKYLKHTNLYSKSLVEKRDETYLADDFLPLDNPLELMKVIASVISAFFTTYLISKELRKKIGERKVLTKSDLITVINDEMLINGVYSYEIVEPIIGFNNLLEENGSICIVTIKDNFERIYRLEIENKEKVKLSII